METRSDPVADIKLTAPPAGDHFLYLDFLREVLIDRQPSPELRLQLLSALDELLQDKEITNLIGWDVMPTLLQVQGSESCLVTISRLANPRECIIGVMEELAKLDLYGIEDDWEAEPTGADGKEITNQPNDIDRFCLLLSLLSILHPRIKTKHPSRILASTIVAIVQAFHPSHRATMAVGKFVHSLSGKKRPTLPGRKSSLSVSNVMRPELDADLPTAPDPEAEDEDEQESAIQKKLLQGLVTTMLEFYITENPLEWAGRLQESFDPNRVVAGRTTLAEAFQTKPEFQTRETVTGQLVALCRDLGLANYDLLFDTIHSTEPMAHGPNPTENLPDSAEDVPLSPSGCLFLVTSLIFSSIMFKTKTPEPSMSIFPDHAKLVARFFEAAADSHAIVDAILAIGLWLEHSNKFVSGEFKDNDFIAHLRALSLWSATNPSPGLRYCAHQLTSAILHAHPYDTLRLKFISKTLQDSPEELMGMEALKSSAVTWLKEELITAHKRKSENLFSTTSALLETKSYLFPNLTSLKDLSDEELVETLMGNFTFYMAVLNFLFFVTTDQYSSIVPPGMMSTVESEYLEPLRISQEKALKSLGSSTEEDEDPSPVMELELLGEQISMCLGKIHEK